MYSDIDGFKPLNIMKDESTNYLSLAGSIIGGLSPIPILSKSMALFTQESDRRKTVEYENRFKNMFRIFRFLTEEGDQGIEYVLTKDVLDQWGSFLRGSFGLSFIGNPSTIKSTEYQIILIPNLGFKKGDYLCLLPSHKQHEKVSAKIVVRVKE